MSVFRNYDPSQAGKVNANAFPRVYSIPWIPTQQNVRANPNIPSQPQRVQPQERGNMFPTSASGGGSLAPQMSSSGGDCGCGGGCSGASPSLTRTASAMATLHSFHGNAGKVSPRTQPRGTGALRPTASSNLRRRLSLSAMQGR